MAVIRPEIFTEMRLKLVCIGDTEWTTVWMILRVPLPQQERLRQVYRRLSFGQSHSQTVIRLISELFPILRQTQAVADRVLDVAHTHQAASRAPRADAPSPTRLLAGIHLQYTPKPYSKLGRFKARGLSVFADTVAILMAS